MKGQIYHHCMGGILTMLNHEILVISITEKQIYKFKIRNKAEKLTLISDFKVVDTSKSCESGTTE